MSDRILQQQHEKEGIRCAVRKLSISLSLCVCVTLCRTGRHGGVGKFHDIRRCAGLQVPILQDLVAENISLVRGADNLFLTVAVAAHFPGRLPAGMLQAMCRTGAAV